MNKSYSNGGEGYEYGPGSNDIPSNEALISEFGNPQLPRQGSEPAAGGYRPLHTIPQAPTRARDQINSNGDLEAPPFSVIESSAQPTPKKLAGPYAPMPSGSAFVPPHSGFTSSLHPPPGFVPYLDPPNPAPAFANNAPLQFTYSGPPPFAYNGPPPLAYNEPPLRFGLPPLSQDFGPPFIPHSDFAHYHRDGLESMYPPEFLSIPTHPAQPYAMWQDPLTLPPFAPAPKVHFEQYSNNTHPPPYAPDSSNGPNFEDRGFAPPHTRHGHSHRPSRSDGQAEPARAAISGEGRLYPRAAQLQDPVDNFDERPIRTPVSVRARPALSKQARPADRPSFASPKAEELPTLFEMLLRESRQAKIDSKVSKDGESKEHAPALKPGTTPAYGKSKERAETPDPLPTERKPMFVTPQKDTRRSDGASTWAVKSRFSPPWNEARPFTSASLEQNEHKVKSKHLSCANCGASYYYPIRPNAVGGSSRASKAKEAERARDNGESMAFADVYEDAFKFERRGREKGAKFLREKDEKRERLDEVAESAVEGSGVRTQNGSSSSVRTARRVVCSRDDCECRRQGGDGEGGSGPSTYSSSLEDLGEEQVCRDMV